MAKDLRAIFLTGELVYCRAYVKEDKEHTAAWLDTPYPVNAARGEKVLKDWHKDFWPRTRHYALCRVADDQIVGGVTTSMFARNMEIRLHLAPWLEDADELRADALRILVPFLSEEWDMVNVSTDLAADWPASIAAAEELGMELAVTLREYYRRPGNERVNLLTYQKLNPKGEFPNA